MMKKQVGCNFLASTRRKLRQGFYVMPLRMHGRHIRMKFNLVVDLNIIPEKNENNIIFARNLSDNYLFPVPRL